MADEKEKQKGLFRQILVPAICTVLLIAVAIMLQLRFGDRLKELSEHRQYIILGSFLISLVGNATVVLPVAVLAILTPIGGFSRDFYGVCGPVYVGLAGGAGAALGEITGYLIGFSGRKVIEKNRFYQKLETWMKRWGVAVIFVFSIVPFVFDVVGIIAGALRIPLWKFGAAAWLGRSIMYVGVITTVAMGYQSILRFFS